MKLCSQFDLSKRFHECCHFCFVLKNVLMETVSGYRSFMALKMHQKVWKFSKRTKKEQNHQFLDNTHFLLEFKGHLIKKKIIISMLYLDVPVNPMYILYFHFCSALVAYIYSMKQNICIYVFKICSTFIAIWILKKYCKKCIWMMLNRNKWWWHKFFY